MENRQRGRKGVRTTTLLALLAILLVWLIDSPTLEAQTSSAIDRQQEYNVKGAYLYSFGRYVHWPEGTFDSPKAPFVIGVLGDAPLDPILNRISKTKTIQGRRILVRKLDTIDEYQPCQILFISRQVSNEQQKAAISQLRKSDVLLVGETPQFTDWGGVMNFYISQETVRFEIDVPAAKKKNLTIDAKLLSVARLTNNQRDN